MFLKIFFYYWHRFALDEFQSFIKCRIDSSPDYGTLPTGDNNKKYITRKTIIALLNYFTDWFSALKLLAFRSQLPALADYCQLSRRLRR